MPLSIDTISIVLKTGSPTRRRSTRPRSPAANASPAIAADRQDGQQRQIDEQIDGDDRQHAAEERTGNVPPGVRDFLGEVNGRRPAVVRVDHRLQREDERADEREARRQQSSTAPAWRLAADRERRTASATNASALSALVTF